MRHGDEGDHRRRGTPSLSAAFHAEQVQPIGHPDAAIVTLEEHVASVGHPEGLPAIGPTVASAGPGPWASTIRSSPDHPLQSPHLEAAGAAPRRRGDRWGGRDGDGDLAAVGWALASVLMVELLSVSVPLKVSGLEAHCGRRLGRLVRRRRRCRRNTRASRRRRLPHRQR
jgi:hypothetical protein